MFVDDAAKCEFHLFVQDLKNDPDLRDDRAIMFQEALTIMVGT